MRTLLFLPVLLLSALYVPSAAAQAVADSDVKVRFRLTFRTRQKIEGISIVGHQPRPLQGVSTVTAEACADYRQIRDEDYTRTYQTQSGEALIPPAPQGLGTGYGLEVLGIPKLHYPLGTRFVTPTVYTGTLATQGQLGSSAVARHGVAVLKLGWILHRPGPWEYRHVVTALLTTSADITKSANRQAYALARSAADDPFDFDFSEADDEEGVLLEKVEVFVEESSVNASGISALRDAGWAATSASWHLTADDESLGCGWAPVLDACPTDESSVSRSIRNDPERPDAYLFLWEGNPENPRVVRHVILGAAAEAWAAAMVVPEFDELIGDY